MLERLPESDPDIAMIDALLSVDPASATRELQTILARLRSQDRPFPLAYGLASLARLLALAGEQAPAEEAAKESLALFRQLGSRSGEARALSAMGIIRSQIGHHTQALDVLNQALALARGSLWPDLHGGISNVLGVVLNDMGRHRQAVALLEEALDSGKLSTAVTLRLRSNLSLALGRWARGDREAGQDPSLWRPRAQRAAELASFAIAHRAEMPWLLGPALDNLANALIVLDRLPEAHQALDEADALFSAARNHYMRVFVFATRARAWLQGGEPAAAVEAADAGLQAAQRADIEVYLDELHLLRSQGLEALQQFEAALAAYKQFHAWRAKLVLNAAEERAQALAVTLDTERARRESRQDVLTGLANRRGFDEAFARIVPRASPTQVVALVLLDLDHFKEVNDTYGHPMGDEALRFVAQLMLACCRQGDVAARFGGDEFALVLAGAGGAARLFCERLQGRLAAQCPLKWPGGPLLTLSIGIAETEAPVACDVLMQRADEALYTVKRQGRNSVAAG